MTVSMRAWGLGVLLGLAGVAVAATTLGSTPSDLTTGVTDPPVQFAPGENADNARYVKSFQLSTNATSFTAEVRPRSGAQMVVTDVVRIAHVGGQDVQVTLTATPVTNDQVEAFEWGIVDGSATVATFDYLDPGPRATFALSTGQTFQMDLRIELAQGAGRHNAAIAFDLSLEVAL